LTLSGAQKKLPAATAWSISGSAAIDEAALQNTMTWKALPVASKYSPALDWQVREGLECLFRQE
jgi:hypothetical protein